MQLRVGSIQQFPAYPQTGVNGLGFDQDYRVDPMVAAYGITPATVPGAYNDGCAAGLRMHPTAAVCVPENSTVFNIGPPAPGTAQVPAPAAATPYDVSNWCGAGLVYNSADGSCNPPTAATRNEQIPGWIWAVSVGIIGFALVSRR